MKSHHLLALLDKRKQRHTDFFETEIQNFHGTGIEKYLVLKMPLKTEIQEFLTE